MNTWGSKWQIACPKCNTRTAGEDFACERCSTKGKILAYWWVESSYHAGGRSDTPYFDLKCSVCDCKLLHVRCPKDNLAIASRFLHYRKRESRNGIAFLLGAIVGVAVGYTSNPAIGIGVGVAVWIALGITLTRAFPKFRWACPPQYWGA